jgi:hypothetical protein
MFRFCRACGDNTQVNYSGHATPVNDDVPSKSNSYLNTIYNTIKGNSYLNTMRAGKKKWGDFLQKNLLTFCK